MDTALSSSTVLLGCIDIPTTGEGAKRRVDVQAVMRFLHPLQPIQAGYIERAQAMPDQGASSGFNYGRAVGALEAIVAGMGIPLTFIEASMWKRWHGLIGKGKEDSRQRAIMLVPGAAGCLVRKKDHNRAEAMLIGIYGRNRPL